MSSLETEINAAGGPLPLMRRGALACSLPDQVGVHQLARRAGELAQQRGADGPFAPHMIGDSILFCLAENLVRLVGRPLALN